MRLLNASFSVFAPKKTLRAIRKSYKSFTSSLASTTQSALSIGRHGSPATHTWFSMSIMAQILSYQTFKIFHTKFTSCLGRRNATQCGSKYVRASHLHTDGTFPVTFQLLIKKLSKKDCFSTPGCFHGASSAAVLLGSSGGDDGVHFPQCSLQ